MSSFWDENKGTFKKAGIATAKGLGKGAKVSAKYGYHAGKSAYNNRNGRTPHGGDAEENSEEHFEVRKLSSLPDPKSFPMPPKRNVGPGFTPAASSGVEPVVTTAGGVSASPGTQSPNLSVRPQPPPPPPRSASPAVSSVPSLPRYERSRGSVSPPQSMSGTGSPPQAISMMDNSQINLEPPLSQRAIQSGGTPSPRPRMALPHESQSSVEPAPLSYENPYHKPVEESAAVSNSEPPLARSVPVEAAVQVPIKAPVEVPASTNPLFQPPPTRRIPVQARATAKPTLKSPIRGAPVDVNPAASQSSAFEPPPTRTVPVSKPSQSVPFSDLEDVPAKEKKVPPPKPMKKTPPPKPSKKPSLPRQLSDLTPVAPSPIKFAQEISNLRLNSSTSPSQAVEAPHPEISPRMTTPPVKPPAKPPLAKKPSSLTSSARVSPRASPRPALPPSRKSTSHSQPDLKIDTLWFTSNDLQNLPPDLQGLTCVASVAKVDQQITKKFGFRGKDLSTIHLTIQWDETDPRTSVTVNSQVLAPPRPSLKQVIEGNNKYGDHIASWCENKEGTQVGDGECWTLARDALAKGCGKHAFISDHLNHGFLLYTIEAVNEGTVKQNSNPTDVIKRGDILQFKECVFSTGGVTSMYGSPDHTCVVARKLDHDGNKLQVLHQNVGGVKRVSRSVLELDTLVKGKVSVFRAMDSEWLVDLHP